ncbi:MAG TPA: extracellular solute-binding protein [Opitutaceae bacterium]|nr:extracellular solute-binding protein [Opitutaceae bacterium]
MKPSIVLRGMTWRHARGRAPMEATARRFRELEPAIEVHWDVRSLKAFEDYPIERLAAEYDLVVLDHPCIGHAARAGALLPLDEHIPPTFLADQARHSTGASHRSYEHEGRLWALATDAAAPVAFWREDLLARHGAAAPRTWADLIGLARRGHVEVPSVPINSLMNFFSFALLAGGRLFAEPDRLVEREAGLVALDLLRELLSLCPPGCWERDPIASHELVASAGNDVLCYCPFAYGYSNYARDGFAAHRLVFGPPPIHEGREFSTVLGGAGLAISARTRHAAEASRYAQFVASPEIQRTLYTHSGGQPGHRTAWLDAENNRLTHGYFERLLPVLDRAWLRPRHDGYLRFQEDGAHVVQGALRGTLPAGEALARLDELHRTTFQPRPAS